MTKRQAPGWGTLAALALATFVPATSQSMLIPALPALGRAFHASQGQVAWTVTGYLITASVGTPIAGRLGDMFGRRRIQLWALALFVLGSVVCILAGSLAVLVVGRLLQGCVGGVFPLGVGVIREEFPAERVGHSIGVLSAVIGIGTSAGFLIGGALVEHVGVRALFWYGLVLGIVVWGAIAAGVGDAHTGTGGRIDLLGAVLLFVGSTLPLLAVSRADAWGWGGARTLALLLGGIVVLVVWVVVELRVDDPLVDVVALAGRTVGLTNVATLLLGWGMFGLFVLTPQLAQASRATGYGFGLHATGAGLLLFPGAAMMLLLGPVSGAFGRRVGHRIPLAAGSIVAGVGLGVLALAHATLLELVLFAMVASAGIGLAFPAMPNLVVGAVLPAQAAESAGFNALLRGLGSAIGTQVTAAVLVSSAHTAGGLPDNHGYALGYGVSAAATFLAGLVAFVIPSHRRSVRGVGCKVAIPDNG